MNHTIHVGDCRNTLKRLPEQSVQCVVTSPPYWGLRDYGVEGQIGLETTPEEYVTNLVEAFREVWRVLRNDGVVWLNLGDTYAQGPKGSSGELKFSSKQATNKGSHSTRRGKNLGPNRRGHIDGVKPKELVGIPWRVAFALQGEGWYLRQDCIWHKPNVMPEPVKDRCTKAHEYLFLLTKSGRYFFDSESINEPVICGANGSKFHIGKTAEHQMNRASSSERRITETRNRRSVWTIPTKPFSVAHFAVFPPALVEPCILAGSRVDDTILDPFGGAGTVSLVAESLERNSVLCELNPEYAELSRKRIAASRPMFANVDVLLSEPDLTATAHTG